MLAQVLLLARWIRQECFDTMQTLSAYTNFIGPWLAKLACIPAVLETIFILKTGNYRKLHLSTLFQRITKRLTAATLVSSEAVLRRTRIIEGTPLLSRRSQASARQIWTTQDLQDTLFFRLRRYSPVFF